MTDVVLLYDADCPHVEDARRNLVEALERSAAPRRWRELLSTDASTPEKWRGYGSPTILVAGEDVAGEPPAVGGRSCRMYRDGNGRNQGVPPVEMIAARLSLAGSDRESVARNRSSVGRLAGMVPALGVGLLPVGLCPACWPVYAGLVSALGLGFLMDAQYLLPITGAALLLALAALAFRARRRRGYGPFAVGLAASVLILIGKFALASDLVLYAALTVLVGASLWNAWPKRKATAVAAGCSKCAATSPTP